MANLLRAHLAVWMTVVSMIHGKIWDSGSENQYHIQTDDGDERYFKYQTLSGQYRRERRLHDGSVVGSYGWVDADGYLRLNDYIADKAGYRIVQAKKLFVGTQTPTSVVSSTKDLSYRKHPISNAKSFYWSTTSKPEFLRSISKAGDAEAISSRNYKGSISRADDFGNENSNFREPDDNSKFLIFPSSSTSRPITFKKRSPTPPLGYYPATTAAPIKIEDRVSTEPEILITPNPSRRSLEPAVFDTALAKKQYAIKTIADMKAGKNKIRQSSIIGSNSVLSDPIERSGVDRSSTSYLSNPIERSGIDRSTSYISDPLERSGIDRSSTSYSSNPIVRSGIDRSISYISDPIERSGIDRSSSYISYNNATSDVPYPRDHHIPNLKAAENFPIGYEENSKYVFPDSKPTENYIKDSENNNFEGVKPNWNGFRYILPRHYHEENTENSGDEKTGSFGYIDPFGIRRVIYYKASPNGFVHKKSNKYVGFNDTPYE